MCAINLLMIVDFSLHFHLTWKRKYVVLLCIRDICWQTCLVIFENWQFHEINIVINSYNMYLTTANAVSEFMKQSKQL